MEKRETTIEYAQPINTNCNFIYSSPDISNLANKYASFLSMELEKLGTTVNENTLKNYILHAILNS